MFFSLRETFWSPREIFYRPPEMFFGWTSELTAM